MAFTGTKLSDLIDPEVLADQIAAKFPDNLVFGSTNLVEVNTDFALGSPGSAFTIPFSKRIADFADLVEGEAMVTSKLTTGKENAVVLRGGGSYETSDVAKLASMKDPMGEIAGQIAFKAARYVDGKLLAVANNTPNEHDFSGDSTGLLTPDVIADGMLKLGDQHQGLLAGGRIIMHSKVYGDLIKLDAITNVYQSGMDVTKTGMVPMIMGLPVMLSDRVTKTTVSGVTDYNTYIVGPGALALYYQRQLLIEFDRDILTSSDIVAATIHFAPHMFGYDSLTSAVVAEDNNSIAVVKIITK
jgi:hypothetical protein